VRSVLTLSLLITMFAPVTAATTRHAHRQHVVVRSTHGLIMGPVSGWAYSPPPRVFYHPAPFDDQPELVSRVTSSQS
jgi:hypothetical protein